MKPNRVGMFSLVAMLALVAPARDVYVSTTGDDGASGEVDEFGVTNFLATMQTAISKLKSTKVGFPTNTVWVAPGTYSLDTTITFGDGCRVLRSLTGRPEDVIFRGDGTRRCIYGVAAARPVIRDVTVENGYPDTKQNWAYGGGGICLVANGIGSVISNCIVRNCAVTFTANEAVQGAGISVQNTQIFDTVVSNCSITATYASKTTDTKGGGASLSGCEVVGGLVTNCFVSGNPQKNGTLRGGGVFLSGGWARGLSVIGCKALDAGNNNRANAGGGVLTGAGALTNCLFSANKAQGYGGGLAAKDGNTWTDVSVVGCTNCNNAAVTEAGGIYFCSGTLEDCEISGNTITAGIGGGLSGTGASTMPAVIRNCRFHDNVGHQSCGALHFYSSSITLTNCLFAGNRSSVTQVKSGYSGIVQIYKSLGNFAVRDCVFTNNVACGSEPMLNASGKDATCLTDSSIRNCLFADNTASYVLQVTPGTTSGQPGIAIENCTIVSNALTGQALYWPGNTYASYYHVRNCAFLGNLKTNATPAKVASFAQNHLTYGTVCNSFSDAQSDAWFYQFTNDTAKANVVGTSEAFADPAAGDWRPRRRRSPLVDAGLSLDWHGGAIDLLGNPRVIGEAVDIGAHEFKPRSGLLMIVR